MCSLLAMVRRYLKKIVTVLVMCQSMVRAVLLVTTQNTLLIIILNNRKKRFFWESFYSVKNALIDTVYYSEITPLTDLKYFLYLLTHIRLDQVDNSTAIPSLSRDVYNLIEVPIAPLNEQKRIVRRSRNCSAT